MSSKFTLATVALTVTLLSGCASQQETSGAPTLKHNDPLESFNRAMWTVNYDYLDPYLLRPAAIGYVTYVPYPVRKGLSNFLANLNEPSNALNNLLMGKGAVAIDHFNRFWINSTFGLFGLIDIASYAGLTKYDNKTFSDAIGHYGVPNGPYVMLPAVGPKTVRNSGELVDRLYLPLSYLNIWMGLGKWALEGLDSRATLVSQEALLKNSPDPYALVKEGYLQQEDFRADIKTDTQHDKKTEDYLDKYMDENF